MKKLLSLILFIGPFALAQMKGEVRAHDPSRVVKGEDGNYMYFTTGPRMPIRYSKDLNHWIGEDGALKEIPAWAKAHVPRGNDWIWAPDVIYDTKIKKWVIFYAYSTFGSRRSVIGALTSTKLTAHAKWVDAGQVVASVESDRFNAIDPGPVIDAKGNLWLSYGSWNTGIKLTRLDLQSLKPSGPIFNIAGGPRTDMEAPFIWHHGGYYYLFYNRGICCQGLRSTYTIYIARSKDVSGPYTDKVGANCYLMGGGSLFMQTSGDLIGPGQAGVSSNGDLFSFHFYNKKQNGFPNFGYGKIKIDQDGWPYVIDIKTGN